MGAQVEDQHIVHPIDGREHSSQFDKVAEIIALLVENAPDCHPPVIYSPLGTVVHDLLNRRKAA